MENNSLNQRPHKAATSFLSPQLYIPAKGASRTWKVVQFLIGWEPIWLPLAEFVQPFSHQWSAGLRDTSGYGIGARNSGSEKTREHVIAWKQHIHIFVGDKFLLVQKERIISEFYLAYSYNYTIFFCSSTFIKVTQMWVQKKKATFKFFLSHKVQNCVAITLFKSSK